MMCRKVLDNKMKKTEMIIIHINLLTLMIIVGLMIYKYEINPELDGRLFGIPSVLLMTFDFIALIVEARKKPEDY
jgi:hypothetical protein